MAFFTVALMATTICAQDKVADSFKVLLSGPEQDTLRVKNLLRFADHYSYSDPDTAFSLALEGLALSRSLKYRKGEIYGLIGTGGMYMLFGNYPDALNAYLHAMKLAEEEKDAVLTSEIAMNLSSVYFYQKDYPQTLAYINKSKTISEALRKEDYVQVALENIGAVYIVSNQLDSALFYTQQAYSRAILVNRSLYNLLLNMGHIYFGKGQYNLSLEYFRTALPQIIQVGNNFSLCEGTLGIARVFEKTGQEDSAVYYAKSSFLLAREKGFVQSSLEAADYLTSFYKSRNKADSAFYYSQEAKFAHDSLFSQQKNNQLQNITFSEKLRQKEREESERQAREDRKHNLQYAALAIGVIGFLMMYLLLSHSVIVNEYVIRFLGVLSLLILFEFINLLIHPFIASVTHHSPVLMLAFMVCIAGLLIPLHHRLEHWITSKLVEKNNRIRLAAAKKVIADLEGKVAM